MADIKISGLTELTTPAGEDLLEIVDDPGGTPASRKVTLANLLLVAWPIGAIYQSVVATSPATLFGGTWAALGAGQVLVGIDAGDADFDTVEETGGAKTHTLTTGEIPAHAHTQQVMSVATGGLSGVVRDTSSNTVVDDARTTASAGGGGAHNNVQPYLVVHRWKRTA